MAGNIFWKENGVATLTSTLAALVQNGGGVANGTVNLDCRTGGAQAEMFTAAFELTVQWSTVTGIVSGTVVGDLYLVPALDGTNFGQVDIANASTDFIQPASYFGSFINALHNPSTSTNYLYNIQAVDLQPLLYKPYIINRSGQTYAVNGTLKVIVAQAQYT